MSPSALAFVVGPGVITALGLVVLLRGLRLEGERARGGLALLLALAYAAGHFGLSGFDPWPTSVTGFLPHIGLLGAVAVVVEGMVNRAALKASVWLLVSGVASTLLLGPVLFRESVGAGLLPFLAAALSLCVLVWLLRRATAARPAVFQNLIVLALCLAVAVACALSGTLIVGQHAGMVAACVGGFVAAALVLRTSHDASAALSVAATLAWGAVLLALFYAEMSTQVLLVVACVPAIVALLARVDSPKIVWVQIGATLVLAGVAGWRALVVSPMTEATPTGSSDSGSDYDYGYGYGDD